MYKIIYADPPWKYQDKSKSHGGAESHYKCLSVEEISDLKPETDKDAVLLLWVTFPVLKEGLLVMEAWGFKYKTCAFTWVKTNKNGSLYMGMGKHTRANAEICLLGVKGKGVPRQSASIRNTQMFQRGKHSAKPSEFRSEIVKLYGDLPKLEMFARSKEDGWDCFGNEI